MSVKLFRHTGFPSSRLPRQKTGAARPAQGLHPAWLLVLACTALTLIGNLPLWQALAHLPQMSAMARLGFGLAMALMLNATLALLLGLLNWRWLLRPLLSVLLLCSALSSHYMLRYNVVIDTPMVLNLLQTNPTEVRDLLSPALLLQAHVHQGINRVERVDEVAQLGVVAHHRRQGLERQQHHPHQHSRGGQHGETVAQQLALPAQAAQRPAPQQPNGQKA